MLVLEIVSSLPEHYGTTVQIKDCKLLLPNSISNGFCHGGEVVESNLLS